MSCPCERRGISKGEYVNLKCGHQFHPDCLEDLSKYSCPSCSLNNRDVGLILTAIMLKKMIKIITEIERNVEEARLDLMKIGNKNLFED